MSKAVSLTISTSINGEAPEKVSVPSTLCEKNGKLYFKYSDENGAVNSILLDEGRIHIGRSSDVLGYKMQLIEGTSSKGIFTNETTFTVITKRANWQFDGKNGNIRMAYPLPDLSDKPSDFVVNISIKTV